ncbi:MAG: GNAT family N-acetyltransferase [Planctomycetota bacterium]|jgi:GNAT superfamily N-acetyltransferase
MPTNTTVASLDQLGAHAFRTIARQLDVYFRLFLEHSDDAKLAPEHVTIITDEPHPLGSFTFLEHSPSLEIARPVVAQLGALDRPSAVILHHAPDEPLASLLAEHEFVLAEPMPAMGVNIESLADTTLPDGYTFEETDSTTAQGPSNEWSRAFAIGYELPQSVADLFSPALLNNAPSKDSVRFFAVRHEGDIVATSSMHYDQGMAGIYCVATHPNHRGKGLGAHLTAEPLRLAANDGHKIGILQASEMGTPVYERIGFQSFGDMMLYVRIPE